MLESDHTIGAIVGKVFCVRRCYVAFDVVLSRICFISWAAAEAEAICRFQNFGHRLSFRMSLRLRIHSSMRGEGEFEATGSAVSLFDGLSTGEGEFWAASSAGDELVANVRFVLELISSTISISLRISNGHIIHRELTLTREL